METGKKTALGALLPVPYSDSDLNYAKNSIAALLGFMKEILVVGLPTNIKRKVWVRYVFSEGGVG